MDDGAKEELKLLDPADEKMDKGAEKEPKKQSSKTREVEKARERAHL